MNYLFDEWNKVKKRIDRKNLFIFLDFDGTLAPIAKTPKRAVLSERTKRLLKKISISPKMKLAFISGRRLEDIKSKIGLKNVIYSGNHGLELEGAGIKFRPLIPPRYKTIVDKVKNDLEEKLSRMKGSFLEDKGLGLSLHYRLVDKKDIPLLKIIFYETVKLYLTRNKIKVKPGKMALEVRPPVEWDKGKIVLWLLARRVFPSERGGILPVYVGDDAADEDAFWVLKNKGLTVFVGKPKKSHARYYLEAPKAVEDLLGRILEIYNERTDKSKRSI